VRAALASKHSLCWQKNILARNYLSIGEFAAADRQLAAAEGVSVTHRLRTLDWGSCESQTAFFSSPLRRHVLQTVRRAAALDRAFQEAQGRQKAVISELISIARGVTGAPMEFSRMPSSRSKHAILTTEKDASACSLIRVAGTEPKTAADYVPQAAAIIVRWAKQAERGRPPGDLVNTRPRSTLLKH